jgi:hypothetical protein
MIEFECSDDGLATIAGRSLANAPTDEPSIGLGRMPPYRSDPLWAEACLHCGIERGRRGSVVVRAERLHDLVAAEVCRL